MEGIMMRNGEKYSIAVRKPDQEIEVRVEPYKSVIDCKPLQKIPIIGAWSVLLILLWWASNADVFCHLL